METRSNAPPPARFEEAKSFRQILELVRSWDLAALSDREFYGLLVVVLGALLLVFSVAFGIVNPPPPKVLVISSGGVGGGYHGYALKYQAVLKRYGVDIEVVPSRGSLDNLDRLRKKELVDTPRGKLPVMVAFAQSGTNEQADLEDGRIQALASIANEPVWIFHNRPEGQAPKLLSQLKGMRIGVDAVGSGARFATLQLLKSAGVTADNSKFIDQAFGDLIDPLGKGELDVLITVASSSSKLVFRALTTPGISLMDFEQADGFVRHFQWLRRIVIPRASLDLANDLPARDMVQIAATANLVVHDDLHPSLAFLLLEAAREIHGQGSAGNIAKEFPSATSLTLNQSAESVRYFETGRPFLQRYLPFWVAVWIDRLVKTMVPVLLLLVPLFKAIPAFLGWREQARISRIYVALRQVEERVAKKEWTPDRAKARLVELDRALENMRPSSAHVSRVFSARKLGFSLRERLAGPPDPGTLT
jgi:TRAP-type uncharacterized transport system substrate-binding protein